MTIANVRVYAVAATSIEELRNIPSNGYLQGVIATCIFNNGRFSFRWEASLVAQDDGSGIIKPNNLGVNDPGRLIITDTIETDNSTKRTEFITSVILDINSDEYFLEMVGDYTIIGFSENETQRRVWLSKPIGT